MGKLTQAWQADDGQFFDTEEKMLDHERDVHNTKLSESWETFLEGCVEGYEYEIKYGLGETLTQTIEDVIEYLKLELETREK